MLDHNLVTLLMELPDSMARAQYLVKTFPEKVVVFTGAGISAESGINPFRHATDGESTWDKYDPVELASMDGFIENPPLVWGWYLDRLEKALTAEPNAGHYALTYNDAPVITQNVDTLHERAGSTKVLHMHGRGDKAKCTECDWHGDMTELKRPENSLPRCPKCGGLGRPDVVWFGEMLDPDLMAEARQLITGSICIVVGTSGQVQPMASFPDLADVVISVNPRVEDHVNGSIMLTGKGGEILTELFK